MALTKVSPQMQSRDFESVTSLLADTVLAYAGTGTDKAVAGNTVVTRSEGFSYEIAASGATDEDVTTAGGVKLYVVGDPTLKAFGAQGDAVTNDQTKLDTAIATGPTSLTIDDGLKFLITALSNKMGVGFEGGGDIVKAISGGLQKLNSYADDNQHTFGLEYMAAFHNVLREQTVRATSTRKPIMVFSGDSTTAGSSIVGAEYLINNLVAESGTVAGLSTPYGLSSLNRGQSGAMTQQWVDSYLAGDLALNPDLLVLRWGINDPGWLKNGTTPPLDAGQDFPNRRDANDFITSLRAGLTTIRATRPVSSLSILLMTPNSTNDTPNARDELWYEQITPGIKQAARDFDCAFIDTYAKLQDSRNAAGLFMDDPFADGRAIHPLNVMNMWIAGFIADVAFPRGLSDKIGSNNIRQVGGAGFLPLASEIPDYWPIGISLWRGNTASGWPAEGSVLNFKTLDDTLFQLNFPFIDDAQNGLMAYRTGRGSSATGGLGWNAWHSIGDSAADVTASAGFVITGAGGTRTVRNGTSITIDGYITKSSPSIVAAGTTIATIPNPGYWPVNDGAYISFTSWNGSIFQQHLGRVGTDGKIDVVNAATIASNRIYPSGTWTNFPV